MLGHVADHSASTGALADAVQKIEAMQQRIDALEERVRRLEAANSRNRRDPSTVIR